MCKTGVANALFHVMKALGIVFSTYITLYLYIVTSVTCVVIGTCGSTCGGHANRRHYVSRSGSLIGLRRVARLGWSDVSGAYRLSGSCAIGFEMRGTV